MLRILKRLQQHFLAIKHSAGNFGFYISWGEFKATGTAIDMKSNSEVRFVYVVLVFEVAAVSLLAEPCSAGEGKEGNCKEFTTTSDGCSKSQRSNSSQQLQQMKRPNSGE